MKRTVYFIPLLLALVGIVIFALQLKDIDAGKDINALETAMAGKPLPKFQLPLVLDATRVATIADLPEGIFLLNVWATWCPSCEAEHAYLNELAQTHNVTIVGLNYKDHRPAAQAWLTRLGNPYRFNLFDEEGVLGFDLGVYGAPETFVVSADRKVLYRHVGVVNQEVWQQTLKSLMNTSRSGRLQ
ncbi:MAG: DsbE family thiol:disulfide interchange protein [Gammaproteobacteria bacterium]|nr:MAG: DsbE family thiol:disulfide interchange protein [Gammaproteobacteria bacterium]